METEVGIRWGTTMKTEMRSASLTLMMCACLVAGAASFASACSRAPSPAVEAKPTPSPAPPPANCTPYLVNANQTAMFDAVRARLPKPDSFHANRSVIAKEASNGIMKNFVAFEATDKTGKTREGMALVDIDAEDCSVRRLEWVCFQPAVMPHPETQWFCNAKGEPDPS